jgi:hypothetical protein
MIYATSGICSGTVRLKFLLSAVDMLMRSRNKGLVEYLLDLAMFVRIFVKLC